MFAVALATVSLPAMSSLLARPPNVVLIISDDQGWGDYGFMGHETIRTPHLDRLANESAVFPRGYVPVSLCRPSLASIVTGLYPHEHRITGNDPARPDGRPGWRDRTETEYLPLLERLTAHIDAVPTLPRLLAAVGYASFQSGKWWEADYARGGFTAGMTHGDPRREGRHGDEGLRIGREGLEPIFRFIDERGDEPFLLWYAPFLPHSPHDPPERLLARYRDAAPSVAIAQYWAMCEWFDETCGELLEHLDRSGLRENTLVVFVGDNGWIQRPDRTGAYAPRSKRSPYEGGVRTPILVSWPGHVSPGRRDALASSIDLAPTILSACGLEPTAAMRGVDLLAVCGGRSPGRSAVYGEIYTHDVQDIDRPSESLLYRWCVRDRWKLIVPVSGGPLELFDVLRDPHERRNLATEKVAIAARMQKELDAWWTPEPRTPGDADRRPAARAEAAAGR